MINIVHKISSQVSAIDVITALIIALGAAASVIAIVNWKRGRQNFSIKLKQEPHIFIDRYPGSETSAFQYMIKIDMYPIIYNNSSQPQSCDAIELYLKMPKPFGNYIKCENKLIGPLKQNGGYKEIGFHTWLPLQMATYLFNAKRDDYKNGDEAEQNIKNNCPKSIKFKLSLIKQGQHVKSERYAIKINELKRARNGRTGTPV